MSSKHLYPEHSSVPQSRINLLAESMIGDVVFHNIRYVRKYFNLMRLARHGSNGHLEKGKILFTKTSLQSRLRGSFKRLFSNSRVSSKAFSTTFTASLPHYTPFPYPVPTIVPSTLTNPLLPHPPDVPIFHLPFPQTNRPALELCTPPFPGTLLHF